LHKDTCAFRPFPLPHLRVHLSPTAQLFPCRSFPFPRPHRRLSTDLHAFPLRYWLRAPNGYTLKNPLVITLKSSLGSFRAQSLSITRGLFIKGEPFLSITCGFSAAFFFCVFSGCLCFWRCFFGVFVVFWWLVGLFRLWVWCFCFFVFWLGFGVHVLWGANSFASLRYFSNSSNPSWACILDLTRQLAIPFFFFFHPPGDGPCSLRLQKLYVAYCKKFLQRIALLLHEFFLFFVFFQTWPSFPYPSQSPGRFALLFFKTLLSPLGSNFERILVPPYSLNSSQGKDPTPQRLSAFFPAQPLFSNCSLKCI